MWEGLSQPSPKRKIPQTFLKDRPAVRIIPFDYVAKFELQGNVGNLIEDVINISVEGTFIAVAIGYSLAADTASKTELVLSSDEDKLKDKTLADIAPHVLMDGFRFNPAFEKVAFPNGILDETLEVKMANEMGLFQHMRQVQNISFLYNIVDTGSGRELQNEPIHNIAALGKANGERPFRILAKPLAFMPRSTIRIQVEEKSADVTGDLYIVLHGYKILGAAGVAEEHLRLIYQKAMQKFGLRAASEKTLQWIAQKTIPSARLVPFDYVSSMDLAGTPGNINEDEININVEGGFVTTAIGYSLIVEHTKVEIISDMQDTELVNIGNIKFTNNTHNTAHLPTSVLKSGFRIRPDYRRLAFASSSLANLPLGTIKQLFELLNLPENVSFLYSIQDTGTGREWQNQPVHNIAGLGIANGDRPFRNLAWPMHFLPRSTIRLRVDEIFGRGRLFIVFQGYKILG